MQRDTLRVLVDAWRSRTGLGIEDLARLVGVHRSRVYRWLEGSSRPETKHLEQLARVLRRRFSEVADALDEAQRQHEGIPA